MYAAQRRHPRHRLALEVELPEGRGVTRDISLGGLYFETETAITAGSTLTFRIILQREGRSPLSLECHGTVVRVERTGGHTGAAVTIDHFDSIVAAITANPFPSRIARARGGH